MIFDCRARLYLSVSADNISPALVEAESIALIRADCTQQTARRAARPMKHAPTDCSRHALCKVSHLLGCDAVQKKAVNAAAQVEFVQIGPHVAQLRLDFKPAKFASAGKRDLALRRQHRLGDRFKGDGRLEVAVHHAQTRRPSLSTTQTHLQHNCESCAACRLEEPPFLPRDLTNLNDALRHGTRINEAAGCFAEFCEKALKAVAKKSLQRRAQLVADPKDRAAISCGLNGFNFFADFPSDEGIHSSAESLVCAPASHASPLALPPLARRRLYETRPRPSEAQPTGGKGQYCDVALFFGDFNAAQHVLQTARTATQPG